jgi:transcriptional regulator with XRE-family HTH domain
MSEKSQNQDNNKSKKPYKKSGFNIEGIKVILIEKKMTSNELADKLGMARTQLSGYVSGRMNAGMTIINRIAEYFKITPDELMNYNSKLKKNGGNW